VTALLLDEMLSGAIAEQLRARGIDVVAVVEDSSLIGTADEDLLDHPAVQQRVLVTANVADFAALANDSRAGDRTHAGIVYVTNRAFPGPILRRRNRLRARYAHRRRRSAATRNRDLPAPRLT
jgi:predicted nuclease of predicted toxin-antitoxin system